MLPALRLKNPSFPVRRDQGNIPPANDLPDASYRNSRHSSGHFPYRRCSEEQFVVIPAVEHVAKFDC